MRVPCQLEARTGSWSSSSPTRERPQIRSPTTPNSRRRVPPSSEVEAPTGGHTPKCPRQHEAGNTSSCRRRLPSEMNPTSPSPAAALLRRPCSTQRGSSQLPPEHAWSSQSRERGEQPISTPLTHSHAALRTWLALAREGDLARLHRAGRSLQCSPHDIVRSWLHLDNVSLRPRGFGVDWSTLLAANRWIGFAL